MAHHLGSGTLPDINADNEVFDDCPAHPLPTSTSSQVPLVHFETGSVLDISVAGSNPEHLAYEGTLNDRNYVYHGRDNHRYGQNLSASTRGYDSRAPGYPISLALSPSQSSNGQDGTLDESLSRFRAYGTIYTDDARMRLGDGIRRQCFNCRTTQTKTWRRSKLNHGKMVCNRCGLFERSHLVPRPETFSPRRRPGSRLTSVAQSWNSPLDVEGPSHYNDHPPVMPLTGPSIHAFSSREGGEITSQDTTWMTHNAPVPDVSSVSSSLVPCPTGIPTPALFPADFQLPTSYSTQQHTSAHHPGNGHYPM